MKGLTTWIPDIVGKLNTYFLAFFSPLEPRPYQVWWPSDGPPVLDLCSRDVGGPVGLLTGQACQIRACLGIKHALFTLFSPFPAPYQVWCPSGEPPALATCSRGAGGPVGLLSGQVCRLMARKMQHFSPISPFMTFLS